MSGFKRTALDSVAPVPDPGSAQRSPLFLNTWDKSPVAEGSRVASESSPTQLVVDALNELGERGIAHADATEDSRSLRRAEKLLKTAGRIAKCEKAKLISYRCSNGHTWKLRALTCGSRLCPLCEKRLAIQSQDRIEFLMSEFEGPVRMLTLTMRNRPIGELAEMVKDLDAAFRRLRSSKTWKRYVRGAIAVWECTVSEERGWHAHIHVAFDGKFMPHSKVRAAWIKATRGEGQQVRLSGQRWPKRAACRYLSKYTTKGVKLSDLPRAVVTEFVEVWFKFRTLRTYGTMFKLKFTRRKWDGVHRCPECGAAGEMTDEMIPLLKHWRHQAAG